MGKYNDIWTKIKESEKIDKERKSKIREEKKKQLEEIRTTPSQIEDWNLYDEAIEKGREDTLPVWATTDYRVIKDYVPPLFNPGIPNTEKNGALKKYRDRFSKYLAFIDCVKFYRSSKYCSILALATTSSALLNIWGSEQNVSNALDKLEEIGLIKECDSYYQTGICKLYYYFVETERLLIDYCKKNDIPKLEILNRQVLSPKQKREYQQRCEDIYTDAFKKKVQFKSQLTLNRPKGVKPEQFKKDLYEMLYENYPGLKIYQQMAEAINKTYYKDQSEFHIRFKPHFHWNANAKKEKTKDKKSIGATSSSNGKSKSSKIKSSNIKSFSFITSLYSIQILLLGT